VTAVLRESVRLAVFSVAANKARSFLTMLGILIGVGAVIALLAVGRGASSLIQGQVEAFGVTTVEVYPGNNELAGATSPGGRQPQLTEADIESLRDTTRAPTVVRVVPTYSTSAVLTAGDRRYQPRGEIVGTESEYLTVRNRTVVSGTGITVDDVQGRRRVAVIGPTIATRLFDGNPVGQTMRVGDVDVEVIGLLDRRGSSFGFDLDDLVVMPSTTMVDTLIGAQQGYASLIVEGVSREQMALVGEQVRATLTATRNLEPGAEPDFNLFEPSSQLAIANTVSTAFTALLGVVAGISLLVGGIGVMNIMLVTVAERTREIGIRKAIGAKPRHLVMQFLCESVVLTLLGGAIGVALGSTVSLIRVGEFTPVVSPQSIVLAFGVSALIGVFFGAYPARRAAAMKPIEALRHE
jgi:putative ABC transport system permease protein